MKKYTKKNNKLITILISWENKSKTSLVKKFNNKQLYELYYNIFMTPGLTELLLECSDYQIY